jgi:hypothetical protein
MNQFRDIMRTNDRHYLGNAFPPAIAALRPPPPQYQADASLRFYSPGAHAHRSAGVFPAYSAAVTHNRHNQLHHSYVQVPYTHPIYPFYVIQSSVEPPWPQYGATANVASVDDHRPLLAERFKTSVCHHHERVGSCPYEHRCMFAHGIHELRTKEMNVADGLVTEEAIREFKRVRYEAKVAAKRAALSTTSGSVAATAVLRKERVATPHEQAFSRSPSAALSDDDACSEDSEDSAPQLPTQGPSWSLPDTSEDDEEGTAPPPPQAPSTLGHGSRYRHDPYAQRTGWKPLALIG